MFRIPVVLLLSFLFFFRPFSPVSAANLEKAFINPDNISRPWVYWFWLNGNLTKEGMTADLEAMQRVGIGGVLIMEVNQGAPVGPHDFMSQSWRELFHHGVLEAQRLGLEVNMNNDAGWNGSGGPWIKPEQSMKKLVWSETNVQGPQKYEGSLAQPETLHNFYRDIVVLAFPSVGAYRIPQIEVKSALLIGVPSAPATDQLGNEMIIPKDKIFDLSENMTLGGKLTWEIPEGNWTILRFGYTTTGVTNSPAPLTGQGLECDKLSPAGIEAQFSNMMQPLVNDSGSATGKSLVATHIDSWENGSQNWTDDMNERFQKLTGYSPLMFLPVMTGRVVESLDVSERFLWDLRTVVSYHVIHSYAGRMHELANQNNLRFTVEAYGSPCDNLPYAGQSDEPMGEFWLGAGAIETCRGMASAGHVYGRRVIGAEAFTAGDQERWKEHPGSIKSLGDRAFCEGINRFVFHRYAMQPWEPARFPGMTMGPWGLHYERTNTWWEDSKPWHDYLARCQYLLQQGLFVADLCYLQPEAPPHSFNMHARNGYDWDEIPPDALINRMSVKDGKLTLPDGLSYHLLVLPDNHTMTPPLLIKIKDLINDGASVLGNPPSQSPSLSGYPDADDQLKQLAKEIWGECDGVTLKERTFGKGKIYRGLSPDDILQSKGIQPDFSCQRPLRYLHRKTPDTDIYFVANLKPAAVSTAATFRCQGQVPELWNPETGHIQTAPVYEEREGLTSVMLQLPPSGSVFVVFRKPVLNADQLVSVECDGKPLLFTTEDPASKVRILKARYGILDDPARTRDVTAKVQNMVDAGEDGIFVNLMAEREDPAHGIVKTLVVDYEVNGKQFTVHGIDGTTLRFPEKAVQVKVEKGVYGILSDPARTKDVTNMLQKKFDSGENGFPVTHLAAEGDPAFMQVKTLKFDYTIDGQTLSWSGTDQDVVDLAPPDPVRMLATVQTDQTGKQVLLTSLPGNYICTTASGKTSTFSVPGFNETIPLDINWQVSFNPVWGGPSNLTWSSLRPWNEHPDPQIKYYSGAATYQTHFEIKEEMNLTEKQYLLDLGKVAVMAEVTLNGTGLGLLWKAPYQVDISKNLKQGNNHLEIRVVNLWPNRMIGDEQLPEDSDRNPDGTLKAWPEWLSKGDPSPTGRFTFTTWRLWRNDEFPLPSGLIGPVEIRIRKKVQL